MENIKWEIDPSHSVVQFKVKHLMIAYLTGRFDEITGTVEASHNFENAKFTFNANINSINTNNELRDTHLKSAEFFDAEKFPKLSFTSTSFTKTSDTEFELNGNLTIKEVTKPLLLNVEYGGIATDPWGNIKAGFQLEGKINRKDFGLIWNETIEAGGTMVSEEVTLTANIELLKK